jgi:hypothetical protein
MACCDQSWPHCSSSQHCFGSASHGGSSSLQWEDLYSVYPFFCFTCCPNEEQILYRNTHRELLRNHDHPMTGGLTEEFRKVFGHRLAIVRDQHSSCLRRQRQHLLISDASEVRSVRRLKVYAWLAPQRRLHDDVVEVSVRLKTHSHGWVLCNRRRAWISFA